MGLDGRSEFARIALEIQENLDQRIPVNEEDLKRRHPEFAREIAEFLSVDGILRARRSIPKDHLVGGVYRLVEEIGSGGMGRVFDAFHGDLDRHVAVKLLEKKRFRSPHALERFRREAQAAARLSHKSIVAVHDFGEDSELDAAYIVMDLIDGVSLARVIEIRRTNPSVRPQLADVLSTAGVEPSGLEIEVRDPYELFAYWIGEAGSALAYAHQSGVIHRDVKPGNILIRRNGSPVLVDFGLARVEGDFAITQTGEILGSPAYMSPEQLSGSRGESDTRTDVYSLGVTLYELLTLERPFKGETSAALVHKILESDPVPPQRIAPDVPKDLQTIALKAMEREPGRRYASTAALAADLNRFRNNEPILARPPSSITILLKRARRNPSAASFAVALGLLVVLACVLLAGYWSNAHAKRMDLRQEAEDLLAEAFENPKPTTLRDFDQCLRLLRVADADYGWWDELKTQRIEPRVRSHPILQTGEASPWMKTLKDMDKLLEVQAKYYQEDNSELSERVWRKSLMDEEKILDEQSKHERDFLFLEELLNIAILHDLKESDLRDLRNTLYKERFMYLCSIGEQREADSVRMKIDLDSPQMKELRRPFRLELRADLKGNAGGARVFLYHYVDQRELDSKHGDPRRVPVPCDPRRGFADIREYAGIRPGAIALVVESADESTGLIPGDLITHFAGVQVGSLFYCRPDWNNCRHPYRRITMVNGETLTDLDVWERNVCSQERVPTISLTLDESSDAWTVAPGVAHGLPWRPEEMLQRCPKGSGPIGRITVVREGGFEELDIPLDQGAGLQVWTTSCPLLPSPDCCEGLGIDGNTTFDDVPRGSYLLLFRAPGHEDLRYPVFLDYGTDRTFTVLADLNPIGTTPRGFQFIPKHRAILGGDPVAFRSLPRRRISVGPFFIRRDEVSWDDYLSFLNGEQGRAIVAAANSDIDFKDEERKTPEYFPLARAFDARITLEEITADSEDQIADWIRPRVYVRRTRAGCFDRSPGFLHESYVHGLDRIAADLFCKWEGLAMKDRLKTICERMGEEFEFRPPTEEEWEAAGRGADGRIYPWGDSFSWQFFQGSQSRGMGSNQATRSAFPVDESPFGVRGLAGGGAVEWCDDDPAVLRGGNFQQGDHLHFRLASRVFKGTEDVYDGTAGVRVCLGPRTARDRYPRTLPPNDDSSKPKSERRNK